MPQLNRITPDIEKFIVGDLSAAIARRTVIGVRPHRIAADVAKTRIGDSESIRALLQQDSTRGVVSTLGVSRAAVFDLSADSA